MNTDAHLTEEQLTDLVVEGRADAHVAGCAQCRERVENFSTAMQDFNAATLAWSAAQPRRARVEPSFVFRFAPAALATAMVALAVATVPAWRQPAAPRQVSAAQIAEDNALLQSVDVALSASDPSPIEQYQLDAPDASAKAKSR